MCKRFFYIIFVLCMGVSPMCMALQCETTKETCVEEAATKTIEGVEVTLDCWKYQTQKTCTVASKNTCQPLQEQGCTPLKAECTTTVENTCLVQAATYQCVKRECTSSHLSPTDLYCKDGSCIDHASIPSTDFDAVVTDVAALDAAGSDVSKAQSPVIFAGKPMECADEIINFKNCCANTGWGKDLELVHCTDAEKALGKKREKGLAVKVGRYCHNRIDYKAGSVCTSHHQVYCVFDSKLAQAIQKQGRGDQLHLSFGVAEGDVSYPNCRAITAEELQQIDLDQIDFSAVYQDIENNVALPDRNATEQTIIDKIKDFYDQDQGRWHDSF